MNAQWLEIRALAWRWFMHSRRRPMVMIAGVFQPLIWLCLFSAVFKNSPMRSLLGADSYLAFITPGTLVFTAFSGALNGGIPVLFDRELGFLDRLLVAPLRSRLSIIWATGFHIYVMTLVQCAVILALTSFMGVRFAGGPEGALVVVLLLGLITLLFTTFSLTLAFVLRYHFELLSIIMIISLPLVFVSTAFAPMAYMPRWLTYPVAVNPVSLTVEPLRHIFFNADWGWDQVLLAAPIGNMSLGHCLAWLVLFNLLMIAAARAVIAKKLT